MLEDLTFYIRAFNTLMCIGAIGYLILNFRKLYLYVHMNLAFIVVLSYIAVLFAVSAISGMPIDPIFSSIGAMLNVFVIIMAIVAEDKD